MVKPSVPRSESRIIHLSNLDLLSGRFPITYIYFYTKTHCIASLNSSLSQCLTLFYPFAGTISENDIVCNDTGALVIEAQANIRLDEFDFYDLNTTLNGKLVTSLHGFLVQIQITSFLCGGIAMTWTFDHALGDATAFGRFLVTWAEISMGKPVSCVPDHSRNLPARSPPRYDPSLEEEFVSCTMEEIRNIPTIGVLLKRLYRVDGVSIDELQRMASVDGMRRTKIEAFSAYVWKVMADVVENDCESCKLGWLVDGRTKLSNNQESMSDYIGNVLAVGFGSSNVMDLKKKPISKVANKVHEAIANINNEEHFRSLIDWIECNKPTLMLSKTVLELGGPTLMISSGRRFPVAELDFGFGRPILGTVCATKEEMAIGYINQRESGSGDGSWTVSAILWPEMVRALESDPRRVFQPMSIEHVRF